MIFPYYFKAHHYQNTIILIVFPIIFDYFKGSRPNLQKLADTNSRPMRRTMTDKCSGAPAKLRDVQASSLYQPSQHIRLN